LEGAFWFAVLLNLKHIFMYVAPAYGVYLLRNYCFVSTTQTKAGAGEPIKWRTFSATRFAKLAAVVAAVFLVSFGPFIAMGQIGQVYQAVLPLV
jgi:alpha-1,3-glucosyltransferase